MTWTKTGTDTYLGSSRTSGQTSATLSAGTTGDLRVILFLTCSSSVSVSSLSGGGVTTWQRAGSVNAVASTTIGVAANAEIWYGQITGSGTALTIAYNGTVGSTSCRLMQRDFRTSRTGSPTYSVSSTGYLQTSGHTSSSPLTWPSLTTKGSDELVVGVMGNFGTMSSPSGSSTGYTYTTDGDANYHVYRLSCAAAEVEAPTLTFSGTDGWYAMSAIFDDGLSAAGSAGVTAAGLGAGAQGQAGPGVAAVTAAGQSAGAQGDAEGTGAAAATAAGLLAGAQGQSAVGVASATAAGLLAGAQLDAEGTGTAGATASAYNAIARGGVTPTQRISVVEAQDRTVMVAPRQVAVVEAESRVVFVSAKDEDA